MEGQPPPLGDGEEGQGVLGPAVRWSALQLLKEVGRDEGGNAAHGAGIPCVCVPPIGKGGEVPGALSHIGRGGTQAQRVQAPSPPPLSLTRQRPGKAWFTSGVAMEKWPEMAKKAIHVAPN